MSAVDRILIIDDDPFFRTLAEQTLWMHQRAITACSNGAQGIASLGHAPPDLVLLDLSLPDLSGLEVLTQLRTGDDWGQVPIVMLTASSDIETMVEAKRLGATGYLVKPVTGQMLTDAVDLLLAAPDLRWIDEITRVYRPR